MTKQEESQKHRQRGRGRKAFWILAAVGLAVALTAAARSSQREHRAGDHRTGGHRGGAHQEFSVERIQELFAEYEARLLSS